MDLSGLGKAHKWETALQEDGYTSESKNSSVYADSITFRHLLTHTSGLSRESKRDTQYSYGSSRTSTPACPPKNTSFNCSNNTDLNWRPWTQSIIPYMMPACGFADYPEKSTKYRVCLPGQYYHYSNAGYSLLGLALDSLLKEYHNVSLEQFFKDNLTDNDLTPLAYLSWVLLDEDQRSRTAHGCQGGETRPKCDQGRPLTDYSDRGIKTPPGGAWSSAPDLTKFMLALKDSIVRVDSEISKPKYDEHSEEDSSHMPLSVFKYGHGFYIADKYTCLQKKNVSHSGSSSQTGNEMIGLYGSWGTVPGFTSYVITSKDRNPNTKLQVDQYSVAIVRNYNYNKRLNLGNQARRLVWRLLNPSYSKPEDLSCPVTVCDKHCIGDEIVKGDGGGGESSGTAARLSLDLALLIVAAPILAYYIM